MSAPDRTGRANRLLDAIDLLDANERAQARALLRELIREDSDFEAAWLWMSVAVETLDESAVCLDNVLRINPGNVEAAEALLRIRAPDYKMHHERGQLRFYRDMALTGMWLLILAILFGGFFTFVQLAPR